MEEIISAFPTEVPLSRKDYVSFVFQPERIAISSNDDISNGPDYVANVDVIPQAHRGAESFSEIRLRFQKTLRNVKSIQLLSAVIPNVVTSIPDDQTAFFYYRVPSLQTCAVAYNPALSYKLGDCYLDGPSSTYYVAFKDAPAGTGGNPLYWIPAGVDGTRPNYLLFSFNNIQAVCLTPTNFPQVPEELNQVGNNNTFNRTFTDYQDLVNTLNICCANAQNATIPNDISFRLDNNTNKIIFVPADTANYFYLPCSYNDPNIAIFIVRLYSGQYPQVNQELTWKLAYNFSYVIDINSIINPVSTVDSISINYNNLINPILNTRLGFTWNGRYSTTKSANPWQDEDLADTLYWYMRPADLEYFNPFPQNVVSFQSYGDLVYSSVCKVFADIVLGSTEDTSNIGGLLSIVPLNAPSLGVSFYQNNFSNPLTKIPENITEIGFRFLSDANRPIYFPNSATITLELAIEYK